MPDGCPGREVRPSPAGGPRSASSLTSPAPRRQSAPVPSGWGMLAAPRSSDSPRGIACSRAGGPRGGRRPPHPLRPPPCACGARSLPMVPLPPVLLFPSPPGAPPAPLPAPAGRPPRRGPGAPAAPPAPGGPAPGAGAVRARRAHRGRLPPRRRGGAVVSLLAVGAGDEAVEAGLVGAEGLVGLPAVLGAAAAPHRAVCPAPGPRLAPAGRRLRRGGAAGTAPRGPGWGATPRPCW